MSFDETVGMVGAMEQPKPRTLPRWDDLPDFGLYMDQVVSLMERYLGSPSALGEKGLTPSMVNNYVKIGAVPPPIKKKYGREHLACLVVVCALKAVLPLAVIRELLAERAAKDDPADSYDRFCERFEASEAAALRDVTMQDTPLSRRDATMLAALSAQAHRNVALMCWSAPTKE